MSPHDLIGASGLKTRLSLRPLASFGTPLFGREADLAFISRLLKHDGVRLVTLTGAGGAGKTRLAVAAAAALSGDYSAGVCFVDLSGVAEPELVPACIARALGIADSGRTPLELVLSNTLTDRGLLLVLDNFEQVVSAASFVARLVSLCPRLAVLVTSREPLHARAEHVVPVRPLALPGRGETDLTTIAAAPSVALFVNRGRARRPLFCLTAENVQAIVDICTRLDGLPLAIELAAAQIGILSPTAILERLVAEAPFVLDGLADLPDRHRTLRAAVASSYDLLPPEAADLFGWCGVLAGPFTAGDAVAVAVDRTPRSRSVDSLPILALLADKNLLQVEDGTAGEPRFRWLETIRGFALDRLSERGDLLRARRRLAEHYVARAETVELHLTGRRIGRTLDAIDRDYENYQAILHLALEGDATDLAFGLRLAGALYRYWTLRGRLREGRQWLERALPRCVDQPPAIRAKALHAAGVLAGFQADHVAAYVYFHESLTLWREMGDSARVASTIGNLGLAAGYRGAMDESLACFRESLALFEASRQPRGVAVALGWAAQAERQQGHTAEAVLLSERSVALFRELGDAAGVAKSLTDLALTALQRGDLECADSCLTEALVLRQKLGDPLGMADCLEGFAGLAIAHGRPRRAARLCGAAEAVREKAGASSGPIDRATHDRLVAAIAARLVEQTLTHEWGVGRGMPIDDAVRSALRAAPDVRDGGSSTDMQPLVQLTRRESEVVALVARGMTNRQVAERLLVAPRTIETHLEHVFTKLGVQTRAEVAAWAVRADLLPTPTARPLTRRARPVLQ